MGPWTPLPGETPFDVSDLKIKGVGKRKELNTLEAENVRKATVKYLAAKPSRRVAPFSLTWLKRLHKQMFGDVWKWAGRFRTLNLNLGIDWRQIEEATQRLLDDLRYWEKGGVDLHEQAAMLHHRTVQIHPFMGGNGRWSRMLANIWLRQHDLPAVAWPEDTIGAVSVHRDESIAAIKEPDEGDFNPLLELQRRFTTPPPPRRYRRPPSSEGPAQPPRRRRPLPPSGGDQ
jgi:Fic-DOC domain mobile mystery protein B